MTPSKMYTKVRKVALVCCVILERCVGSLHVFTFLDILVKEKILEIFTTYRSREIKHYFLQMWKSSNITFWFNVLRKYILRGKVKKKIFAKFLIKICKSNIHTFKSIFLNRVLLKTPTTNPPITDQPTRRPLTHGHTDPPTGYHQFTLKQRPDSKH